MKGKVLQNSFLCSLIFSIILSLVLPSCFPKIREFSDVTSKSISLKLLNLQYGAYDFNIKNKFVAGRLHLNYINRDNYWEYGIIDNDSINIVKFDGAIYKRADGHWRLFSNYSKFDLPYYIMLVLPDEKVRVSNLIKFKPNPVIVQSENAVGEILTSKNQFYSLKIKGKNYSASLTLLRMLPVFPERFQTKITLKGLSQRDSKILYRRLKVYHPILHNALDTTFIRVQGYISNKLFNIIVGKGEFFIYPLKYDMTIGYKQLNFGKDDRLYYKKIAQNFKIIKIYTENNNILVKLSPIINNDQIYGLFIDNNLVGIGKSDGIWLKFNECVNSISLFINPVYSNGYINSKISILRFLDPYNRR